MRARASKILVIRNANAFDFGGAETYALNLCRALAKHSIRSTLITQVPDLHHRSHDFGVEVMSGPWFKHQDWGVFPRLVRPIAMTAWYGWLTAWYVVFILKGHYTAVHAHSRDDFIAATFAARITRRPIVWTDHADLKYILGAGGKNLVGRLTYLASTLCPVITVVSDQEKQNILSAEPNITSKLRVIYNGVFNDIVAPAPKKTGVTVFGVSSRLVIAKGIAELITAFRNVSEVALTPCELWLIGDGPDREQFMKQAAMSKQAEKIIFLGYQKKPLEFVAALDFFVHPSYNEGFSMAILEAAMLGKAIIATRVGGTPEIITDHVTGLLVESKSVESLTEAILYALNHPGEMQRYAEQLRRVAVAKFDFDQIVASQIIPLYEHQAI